MNRKLTKTNRWLIACGIPALLFVCIAVSANAASLNSRHTDRNLRHEVADFVVKGTVKDKQGPLPGVTVVLIGNNNISTVTDSKGNFSIKVPEKGVLLFTSVGYKSIKIPVDGEQRLDIIMEDQSTSLNEVVVTALGIKSQTRTLEYSTQSVKASQLTEIRDPSNLVNSLEGKVAGALITQSAFGVGSESQIILRGNRDIQGNNSALIVVDGVPALNNSSSNINPDDIESVTILPGASAGALYGSQAGNGAVIITTKMGAKGKLVVNLNSGLIFNSPFALPQVQNTYGQGNAGILDPSIGASWGAKMTGQSYTNYLGNPSTYSPQPNNIKDFFNTGSSENNSISVSQGTDKMQTYLSYTNNIVNGIIPTNDLISHTINLRLSNQISKRFSTDAKITYFRQDIKNETRGAEANNTPVMDIYQIPRNVSLADAQQYQTLNNVGVPVPTPWPSTSASNYQNPYWETNNDILKGAQDQVSGYLSAKYQIADWLSVTSRANVSKTFDLEEQSANQGTILFANNPGGYYRQTNINTTQKWFDAIFEGNNKITDNLKLNYHAGLIYQDNQFDQTDDIADGLNITNKFSLNYATTPEFNSVSNEIQTQSAFGQANLSYKGAIYLNGTLRNDWDSRLPAPHSFQYYSAGTSVILSDLIRLPKDISYLKTSLTYAEVGNGGQFGLLTSTYGYTPGAGNGYLSRGLTLPFPDLKPEIVKNIEASVEARFLDNRLGFTFTYYKSNSLNQLLQINLPVATGYASEYINAGNIENHGFEAVLNATPIKSRKIKWDIGFNMGMNRNKIISLTNNLNTVYLGSFGNFGAVPQVKVGGSYGDIVADQWQRDSKGNFVVTAAGLPLITSQSGRAPAVIGNFNPNAILGLTNTFGFDRFSLRVLVSGRLGGIMVSSTETNLSFSGITEATAQYRAGGWNLGGVDLSGKPVSATITSQQFWQTVSGQRSGVGEFYAYDATNFRIGELSLGYTIPVPADFFIKSARISVVSHNFMWLYRGSSILDIPGLGKRKMWFDPDMGKYAPGVEYGAIPSTRSVGLNLNVTF